MAASLHVEGLAAFTPTVIEQTLLETLRRRLEDSGDWLPAAPLDCQAQRKCATGATGLLLASRSVSAQLSAVVDSSNCVANHPLDEETAVLKGDRTATHISAGALAHSACQEL